MWLRKGCSNLLNSCLFQKDGIVATVRAICDVYSEPKSKPNCDSWAQHVILGKLFVMAVKSKKGDDLCCRSICSQVIELLSAEKLKDSKDYARAGLACLSMLWDEDKEVCTDYILKFIFPFITDDRQVPCQMKVVCQLTDNSRCADDQVKDNGCTKEESKVNSGKQSYIPDSEIDSSLALIHFCFVENDPGMSLPSKLLAPVFPVLLKKFHCVETHFNRKSIIKSLLIKFLVSCGDESLLSQTLNSVLFEGSYSSSEMEKLAHEKEHSESENGVQNLEENEEDLLKDILERHLRTETLDKPVEEIDGVCVLGWGSIPLLDLVSSDGGGEAAEVLFRYILSVFPKVGEKSSVCKESEWLLCIAKQSVATKILCHLLEVPAVSEQIRKHPIDVVTFLGNFLAAEAEKVFGKNGRFQVADETGELVNRPETQTDDSLLNVLGESSFPPFLNFSAEETKNQIPGKEVKNESEEENHSEFVLVALLILKSLCECGHSESEENWWNPLRSILPQIRAFRRESSCPEVRAMAEDLACAILTKGKVGKSPATESFRERGENLSKTENQKNVPLEDQESCDQRPAESGESEFEAALKMAHENAVHLRGHALIRLSKLIKSKDAITLRHKSALLELFQANLKDDDSYIYLASINGLEQLGNMFPDQVLESLADEFAEISIVKAGDKAFNNVRLKVGEALLKVTRTLGEMVPKYSTLLLNAFLGGVRDGDGLVRASSLSNLGEVCKLLSFRIGSIITEVLWCVRCVLETDVAVEARRAAVLVITLLLQGMGVEIFKVLETILPEMYRTLKTVRDSDSDEIVKIHAQMALEEVNRITKEFLFPQQKLQKKIFVLDVPS
ncbi:hypothetical protein J437_LFUL011368 [Ladona fulva]|uniref:Transport and Golgi organization protein 6 homolog n=1 Tax=Ladona fulva TaxID=123851 RepID=A0A8K0KCZ8_LADFU|nr:hypothetical protein J437_LFUL011368 [Ladona fulva]